MLTAGTPTLIFLSPVGWEKSGGGKAARRQKSKAAREMRAGNMAENLLGENLYLGIL